MKPTTLIKVILVILFIFVAIFFLMALSNLWEDNYQPLHDRLEQWVRSQKNSDPKWARDASKVTGIILLTALEVYLLWVFVYMALRSLLKLIIKKEDLGPGMAIPIAGLFLLGMGYLGLEIYRNGPLIEWISGPSNVVYPGKQISHYFFISLGPTVAAVLIGISIFLFTLVESGRCVLKAK